MFDESKALKTFICGHGAWDPKDGYTKVPQNCQLTFYTENSKWMNSHEVFELIKGTQTLDIASQHGPFKTVPNMKFYPDDEPLKAYSKQIKPADVHLIFTTKKDGKNLSDLFSMMGKSSTHFDVTWACCRDIQLRETGYKPMRVEQRADGYYDYDFDTEVYQKLYGSAGLSV